MISRLALLTGLFFTCLCGLVGCANYQLGTAGKLSFTTLYVEPVENSTSVPQARAILSTQIRQAFAQDGRVQLVNSAADADATLQVAIRDYHRDVSSVLENDTALARKYSLTLGVVCTLRDNRKGADLFAGRAISVQRDAFTDDPRSGTDRGQLQSEFQVMPILADALAKKVANSVLDVW